MSKKKKVKLTQNKNYEGNRKDTQDIIELKNDMLNTSLKESNGYLRQKKNRVKCIGSSIFRIRRDSINQIEENTSEINNALYKFIKSNGRIRFKKRNTS